MNNHYFLTMVFAAVTCLTSNLSSFAVSEKLPAEGEPDVIVIISGDEDGPIWLYLTQYIQTYPQNRKNSTGSATNAPMPGITVW